MKIHVVPWFSLVFFLRILASKVLLVFWILTFPIGLGLSDDDLPPQMSRADWPEMRETFTRIFASKTQAEWTSIFDNTDACTTPILTTDEASQHPQNKVMSHFLKNTQGSYEPTPAPILSRTPGKPSTMARPATGQDTATVLAEAGYSEKEIEDLVSGGDAQVADSYKSSKLWWDTATSIIAN